MEFAFIRKALQLQVSDYVPSTLPAEELVKSVAAVNANQRRTEDDVIHRVKEYVGKSCTKILRSKTFQVNSISTAPILVKSSKTMKI